jgi:hypothetical protein
MQPVDTSEPAGAICLASGEIARYGVSLQCLTRLKVPNGSLLAWYMGVLVAENLNRGLEAMMENPNLGWAWIMGDDHTYDSEIILNLLRHDKEAVLPLCLNRYPPLDPNIINETAGRQKWLEEMPTRGLYRLGSDETVGDAGLLLRRSVVEKLERPYYDRLRSGSFKSEDQAFTRKLQRAGVEIWVDCENTIGHIASVCVQPVAANGEWRVRLTGGMKHIVDVAPQRVGGKSEQLDRPSSHC